MLRRNIRDRRAIVADDEEAVANLVPAVLSGAVELGLSPTVTPGTWTGSPTLTYTMQRSSSLDGAYSNISGLVGVSKATIEAYVYAHSGTTSDIGPNLRLLEIPNGDTGGQVASNVVRFADTTYLSSVSLVHTAAGAPEANGITLSGSGVVTWATSYGGDTLGWVPTQATVANRPTWNATGGVGGRPRLEFDGANDVLFETITKGSAWTAFEIGFVGHQPSSGSGVDLIVGYNSGTNHLICIESAASANVAQATNGAIVSTYTTAESTTNRHWSFDCAGGASANQFARVAGTAEDTDVTVLTSHVDGGNLCLGGRSSSVACAAANMQAAYFSPSQLSADQRSHIRALLTFLTGVAC